MNFKASWERKADDKKLNFGGNVRVLGETERTKECREGCDQL